MSKVRVLRVLEYYGKREAIESHLEGRTVTGSRKFFSKLGLLEVREGIVGEYPIPLEDADEVMPEPDEAAANMAPYPTDETAAGRPLNCSATNTNPMTFWPTTTAVCTLPRGHDGWHRAWSGSHQTHADKTMAWPRTVGPT